MRRCWLLALAVAVAGCGSHRHAREVTVGKPTVSVSAAEIASIERRRQRELIAARVFRERSLDVNRLALDSVPVFPRAVLEQEVANAEYADEPGARFAHARPTGIVVEDNALLAASGWGTFRIYSLPLQTERAAVVRFYLRRLRPQWRLVRVDRDRIRFRRASRCLWFRVPRNGTRLELGTDVAVPPSGCLAP